MGKTTLAEALASKLGYALVCKDDVRDVAVAWDSRTNAELQRQHPGTTVNVDTNEMAYEACFAIGLTQLRVGAAGVRSIFWRRRPSNIRAGCLRVAAGPCSVG